MSKHLCLLYVRGWIVPSTKSSPLAKIKDIFDKKMFYLKQTPQNDLVLMHPENPYGCGPNLQKKMYIGNILVWKKFIPS